MTKNSYVLIHQLNLDGTWGKYEDFKDQMENLDNFMNKLKQIYSEETSIPIEMMGDVMKRDIYFDSKKCLDLKIVDAILQ
jgi:ATP-dependent protease ClpP protease subunit